MYSKPDRLKVLMKRLYADGEPLDRYQIGREVFYPGWFERRQTQEGGYNRAVWVAEFRWREDAPAPDYVLYDAEPLRIAVRMTVRGFERVQGARTMREQRQSWLLVVAGQGEDEDALLRPQGTR